MDEPVTASDVLRDMDEAPDEAKASLRQWLQEADDTERRDLQRLEMEAIYQKRLYVITLLLLCITFGMEAGALFFGTSPKISGELTGRILGTVDTLAVMVGIFWFRSQGADRETVVKGKK